MTDFLHIAAGDVNERAWPAVFQDAVRELGELRIVEHGNTLTDEQCLELYRNCRIAITSWGSRRLPGQLAADRGRLEYVCHLTGTLRATVPLELVEAGIPVTNWGDAIAESIAESALALLLATLQGIASHVLTIRAGGWRIAQDVHGGLLHGADVGIYGLGVIGLRFVELIRAFHPVLRVYDPYAGYIPPDCRAVMDLDELFGASQIVVIHAGLTDQTRRSVTARHLAKLPDFGVLINTARGAIVDEAALMAELESGRLRAGLDVLAAEPMAHDHPARRLDNVIVTSHQAGLAWPDGGKAPTRLNRFQEVCIENLRRHLRGGPVRFRMTRDRYLHST